MDLRLLRSLAGIGCTVEEMAAVLGVSKSTLDRHCGAAIEHGRGRAKLTLRRLQWRAARRGSVTMMIWLGKDLLGQRDRPAVELTGPGGGPIQFVTNAILPERRAAGEE